jgi:hypothetical protein
MVGIELHGYIGAYALLLSRLTELAMTAYRWKPKRLGDVINAINAAVMLDMDLVVSAYQDAREKTPRPRPIAVAAREPSNSGIFVTIRASKLPTATRAIAASAEALKVPVPADMSAYADWIDQSNQRILRDRDGDAVYDA